MTLLARVDRYLSLIRFPHTLFALPFAVMSYLAATEGALRVRTFLLVLLAMVSARTAAMTFNRIADRGLDAANPRTAGRELVTGAVRLWEAGILLGVACVLFIAAAYLLNPLAFALSPVALVILLGYSYTKRFTSLSHFVLGTALGLAPPGAWIAATGTLEPAPVILGGAVLLWVAGFDIIYSCQDVEHDITAGLHSLAARCGVGLALLISAVLHALCLLLLALFAHLQKLGFPFHLGLAIVAASFIYQHAIVRPSDLSRLNTAFFTVNGFVGLTLLAFFLVDIYS